MGKTKAVLAAAASLIVLLGSGPLAADPGQNYQRVRAMDDPVVSDVEDVLLDSGSLFLSYAAPYSDAELRSALARVDPDKLSDEGRAKYDSVREALKPNPGYSSGELAAKANLDVALDANWRSDDDVPWVLGYQQRPSFLDLSAEAWAGPGPTATARPRSSATTAPSTIRCRPSSTRTSRACRSIS